jgi:hypothetical protein
MRSLLFTVQNGIVTASDSGHRQSRTIIEVVRPLRSRGSYIFIGDHGSIHATLRNENLHGLVCF